MKHEKNPDVEELLRYNGTPSRPRRPPPQPMPSPPSIPNTPTGLSRSDQAFFWCIAIIFAGMIITFVMPLVGGR